MMGTLLKVPPYQNTYRDVPQSIAVNLSEIRLATVLVERRLRDPLLQMIVLYFQQNDGSIPG